MQRGCLSVENANGSPPEDTRTRQNEGKRETKVAQSQKSEGGYITGIAVSNPCTRKYRGTSISPHRPYVGDLEQRGCNTSRVGWCRRRRDAVQTPSILSPLSMGGVAARITRSSLGAAA